VQGVIALAFSPDGKTLASSGVERDLRLWDVKAGRELPPHDDLRSLISAPKVLQVTPDSKRLLAWLPEDRRATVSTFDLATGRQLATFHDTGRTVEAVAFTADGKQAALGARDGSVR